MSNPIFQNFQQANQNGSNSASLMDLMNQIRRSPNPDAAAMNMINNDPQFQDIAKYINANGGNARAAFYNMAAQQGKNPDSIIGMLKGFFGM